MTSVLIRCDASLTIGSGHVMRCRTLGRELQRRGTVVVFACRRQSGDLISLLEQDFPVLPLPEQPLLPSEELSGRELYGAWLGCSQEQDAADCLKALQSAGISHIDWFVVDHYGLDASWESLVLAGQAGKAPSKLLLSTIWQIENIRQIYFWIRISLAHLPTTATKAWSRQCVVSSLVLTMRF